MPVGLPQGQLLAQGGLVDLDDLDAGGLKVKHLVADGQGELLGLLLVGDVLTRPGPVENGTGPVSMPFITWLVRDCA